jgi:Flp pilus assembly pilin Flp
VPTHPIRARVQRARRDQRGQTTVEYALVILAAAAIAGLLIAWAANSGAIGRLFDSVVDRVAGTEL